MGPIRQGDLILLPTVKVLGDKLPHLTLVEGVSTGHSHRISKGIATLFSHREQLYLQVRSRFAILSHDEHRPLKVHHGNWKIYVQREYAPQKNSQLSLNLEQEFITSEDTDQEFLKDFVEGVRSSSTEQLIAEVLQYSEQRADGSPLPVSSAAELATQKAAEKQPQSNPKQGGRSRALSNWKYVVD
ncbi:hypothetical protein N836_26370 [Leptolyngbya sp. Heron Island J]|uniref:hypothetical protein n=1 Tax=Leptolyngbya sp. Heron Island J TaxID=1385935 RepID=UPI0003B99AE0|nr:hypothetical protein [Leptolyngbya sp. Heron Island J]ESA32134.1 hypothetical protein N836_26370 [Leptolyngbya sp. Heron Island J]